MVAASAAKAVSLAEAAAEGRLGGLIEEIAASGDGIIVEAGGQPAVAIVPIADYEELLALRRARRREEAAARLRALRAEVLARNTDLTPEEAEDLSARAVREVIDDMAREGKLLFERDVES